ncbi:MAG: hypothetical protein KBS70_05735 [Bacteroidales bacterium]|nr:hypothetical protein [Candidatus Colicola equi]
MVAVSISPMPKEKQEKEKDYDSSIEAVCSRSREVARVKPSESMSYLYHYFFDERIDIWEEDDYDS